MLAARLPLGFCPFCKAKLDAATMVPDQGPEVGPAPGDVTVCAYCQGVLMFDGDPLAIRIPTLAELKEVATLPELQRAQVALAMSKRGPSPFRR